MDTPTPNNNPQPNAPSLQQGPLQGGTPAQGQGGQNQGFRGGRGGGGRFGRGPGGPGRGRRGGPRQGRRGMEKPEFESKTLDLARVSRVTKGGKRFTFRATVVAGDQKGRVGVGIGKGKDVQQSIQKAYNKAKKNFMKVVIVDGTIPYQVQAKYSSASVILKPSKGGIKAGGAVRVVAQIAGIQALTGKLLGRTNNKINIARATLEALKQLRPRNGAVTQAEPAKPEAPKTGEQAA
ncbi:MAG TPA: 30S ribosomal protein S5 [Candidatus Paceibacterota bacterium]|nr:30S ribosomal protein S5 [Candidatus Paceibacterota bacterium]